MKRRICIMAIAIMVMLSSCGSNKYYDEGYEIGFSDGYSAGQFDADIEHEDDYALGYEDGYDDGYDDGLDNPDFYIPGGYSDEILDIIREIQWDAENYSSSDREYDIESAMVVVDCYLDNKPDAWGEWYSVEDFKEASLVLYRFYEYFYGGHYD